LPAHDVRTGDVYALNAGAAITGAHRGGAIVRARMNARRCVRDDGALAEEWFA
jgi:hypothetical protein